MNDTAISTNELTKQYGGDVLAVDALNLSIPAGIIYALLGPNGAGKTTTLSLLTTLIAPTSGSALVAGCDIVRQPELVRRQIGVTFQEIILDPDLTGREALDFHARLYRIPKNTRRSRIEDLLNLTELKDSSNRRTGTYSGGMKRRLELARGLITDPSILFLDEPTQGLDPQNRARIWDHIRSLRDSRRMTILLTTHSMEEAETLADRVGIIDHGRLVVEGSPSELIERMGSDMVQITGKGDHDAFCRTAGAFPYVDGINKANGLIQIGVDNGNRRLVDLVDTANKCRFAIEEISVARPGLGDVFLKYTGRQLRDT